MYLIFSLKLQTIPKGVEWPHSYALCLYVWNDARNQLAPARFSNRRSWLSFPAHILKKCLKKQQKKLPFRTILKIAIWKKGWIEWVEVSYLSWWKKKLQLIYYQNQVFILFKSLEIKSRIYLLLSLCFYWEIWFFSFWHCSGGCFTRRSSSHVGQSWTNVCYRLCKW